MFMSFRVFRKVVLWVIFLDAATSLALALYLKPSFIHPNSVYVLVGILIALIFASALSVLRRAIFDSPQTVVAETLGLLALLPFSLILVLYALGLSVTPHPTALWIFAILRILLVAGISLHVLYTIGLACTAMLTVCAFDRDVWSRDIDSSPSPFPMFALMCFVFPHYSGPEENPCAPDDVPEHQILVCLPGSSCNCSIATSKTSLPISPEATSGMQSRSLVRVPNDVERRTSIVIAFDV
ncbi:hypothetical protein GGX14DRAFT_452495 [Mycena pura]|uniref:Transmembrane protein n=1 Tax=Mycena pura TaxID=153505 RepID=A0AAD6VF90_9AGAR|nr:hypothetical protein GGX14DRAFT_452495 [Mycena pura]